MAYMNGNSIPVSNYSFNPYQYNGQPVIGQPNWNQVPNVQPASIQNQQIPNFQPQQFNKSVGLQGEYVDNEKTVDTIKYPYDGSTSYYPLTDGTAIISKQLDLQTGKSITIKYIPVKDEPNESKNENVNIDYSNKFEEINNNNKEEFDIIKEQMQDILKEMKELKTNLKQKGK